MKDESKVFELLKGKLIVSCQAYPGEPMRDAETMSRVAQSVVIGGAAGIRAQGLDDIAAISSAVKVPLIGLVKVGKEGVFITPGRADALRVAEAGADVVALDATRRDRPNGEVLADIVRAVHESTGALVLGDVGSFADAQYAIAAGVDAVATTLSGYTEDRPGQSGPDIELVEQLVAAVTVPVFAEGRYHSPHDARRALDAGAHAVIVGTAITHPASITSWFRDAIAR